MLLIINLEGSRVTLETVSGHVYEELSRLGQP